MISAIVALIVAMATIQSTQASIDYWLQKPDSLSNGVNQIKIYCRNGGGMDGDFYLVLKFTNATFSTQTQMPYIQVDNSTVKVKFILHRGDSLEKDIFFVADGTNDFSVGMSLEKASFVEFIKANAFFPTQISYRWNESFQNFNCTDAQ